MALSHDNIRLNAWLPDVRDILGPGLRAVVWVQGCTLRCPGCMVPETWDACGGYLMDIEVLAREMLAHGKIDGITISGGEPTEQPESVARLLTLMKAAKINTWVYTGYTLEELVAKNNPAIDYMLSQTDVLVDGRMDTANVGAYFYRGSANQRIIHLTDVIPDESAKRVLSTQFEIRLDTKDQMILVGIPPANFFTRFVESLACKGIKVQGY